MSNSPQQPTGSQKVRDKIFSRFNSHQFNKSASFQVPDFSTAPNQMFLHISLQEQVIFIKRLSLLIRAGVPLLSGLHMLKKQASSRSMVKILDRVIADVENGQYLATSLGRFRKIFGEFTVNLVEIGEISGTLSENLEYLAAELKKTQALRRKVIGSLIYPVLIIFATFGITALLTVYVFPKILPIFKSVNFPLPWSTRSLIFISDIMLHYGTHIAAGLAGLAMLFWILLKIKSFRYLVHRFILTLPLIGSISQSYNVTNICRTMGLLLKSNVLIVRSIKITSHITRNAVFKRELEKASELISRGEPISKHLETRPNIFPLIMSQMVTVGENTGNLSETFLYLANMYEEEVDELTKNLSVVIEPMLLIFMGLLVGFVAISIITPIYGITQHFTP